MLGRHTSMLFKYGAIQKHCTKEACSVTPSERARTQLSCPGAPERPPAPACDGLPCSSGPALHSVGTGAAVGGKGPRASGSRDEGVIGLGGRTEPVAFQRVWRPDSCFFEHGIMFQNLCWTMLEAISKTRKKIFTQNLAELGVRTSNLDG